MSVWARMSLFWVLSMAFRPAAEAAQPVSPGRPPDVETVLSRAFERAKSVSERVDAPVYAYRNRSWTETLASDGAVKKVTEKEYRVTLTRGMTHNLLIALNGQPLTPEDSAARTERERRWRDKYAVGPGESTTERMDQLVNQRLFERFEFVWVRRESVRGRPCHVLTFRPRPGRLPEERLMDRVINRLHGTVWFDEEVFEIARAEAHTEGSLRVWGGLLGALEFLRFTVERERAEDDAWFARQMEVVVRGRKLWSPLHVRLREVGSDFRPWTEPEGEEEIASFPP